MVGDLDRLRVGTVPDLRHPEDVTQPELLDAALDTIATMMGDLREIRRENTRMTAGARGPADPVGPPRRAPPAARSPSLG